MEHKSCWAGSVPLPVFPRLEEDIQADVAIVGGGMAGLLTAFMLQREGVRAVVLEAGRIVGGTTQNTTAKITAQHGLVYTKLEKTFGREGARQYAAAQQDAIEQYRALIEQRGIACAFEEQDAYLYTRSDPGEMERETAAACRAGIAAERAHPTGLPFSITAAVRFPRQAQFNPVAFAAGIAGGLRVYEHSRVLAFGGDSLRTGGGSVRAPRIVIATHYPPLNVPGYYFLRMYQQRSYVLALKDAPLPKGMYIGTAETDFSLRSFNGLLLFGGAGHRAGQHPKQSCFETLRKAAKQLYPQAQEYARWSAQDCMTLDGVPYIGAYSKRKQNLYVATGFNKWGMTGSMAAAVLLRDRILGRDNPNASLFEPHRLKLQASAANLMQNTGHAVAGLCKQAIYIPSAQLDALARGHGGIVRYEHKKAGVYKDEDGYCHIVDVRCPHMGCQLEWNPDEKTWDCPCHGSRFDYRGNWIESPAVQPSNKWKVK